MSERVPHMPAIFVGHGSPMNALGGDYARTWRQLGDSLPRPIPDLHHRRREA